MRWRVLTSRIGLLALAVGLTAGCSDSNKPEAIPTWRTVFGEAGWDEAVSVMSTSGDEIVVVGSDSPGPKILLTRFDKRGTILKEVSYGDASNYLVHGATLWSNGDILVAARVGDEACILRFNPDFAFLWESRFAAGYARFGSSIVCSDGDSACVAGTQSVEGLAAIYLRRTDGLGNLIWERTYVTAGWGWANSVIKTADGGFLVAGSVGDDQVQGEYDPFFLKVDADGDSSWALQYTTSGRVELTDVSMTDDSGYLAAGFKESLGHDSRVQLIKLSPTQGVLWERSLSFDGGVWVNSMAATPEGGFALAGTIRGDGSPTADMFLLKIDHSGNPLWDQSIGEGGDEFGIDMISTSDHGYCIVGSTSGDADSSNDDDAYVVKTDVGGRVE